MNRTQYESKLEELNVAEACACPNHGLQIVELKRKEFGYQCQQCDYSYPYKEILEVHCK